MVNQDFVPSFDDDLLKPHNQKIYKKIIKNFKTNSKTLIVQATGTGKSYLAMKFVKDFGHQKRVLFVAPTDVILNKFSENVKLNIENSKDIKLTTSTYAGLGKQVKKDYDIIIFDEVHRSGAEKWGEDVKNVLASHPNSMVLGMTATLEREDDVDVAQVFGVLGPVNELSLLEAVQSGILPTPDYSLAKVDFSKDKKFVDDAEARIEQEFKKTANKSKRASLVNLLAQIGKAKKLLEEQSIIPKVLQSEFNKKPKLKNGKFIVFVEPGYLSETDGYAEVDKRILDMVEQQAKNTWFNPTPKTYKVHSNFGSKHNKKTIDEFEQDKTPGIKLLFSVNMLNEGLHVDDIDGVIMLRSTQSKTIYLQQLGRALSVGKNKQPKIFDFVANIDYTGLKKMLAIKSNHKEMNRNSVQEEQNNQIKTVFPIDYVNYDKQQFFDALKQNIIQEFAYSDEKVVDEVIHQMRAYLNSPDYLNLSEKERLEIDTNVYNVKSLYKMPSGFNLYRYLAKIGAGVNNPDDINAIIPTEEQKAELERLGVCFDEEAYNKKRVNIIINQLKKYLNSPDYLNLSEKERLEIDTSAYNVKRAYKMPSGFNLYSYLIRIGVGVNNPDDRNAIIPTEEQKAELESLGVCFNDKKLKEKIAYKTAIYELSAPKALVFENLDEMKVYEIIQNLKEYLNSPDYLNLSEKERLEIDISVYNVKSAYKMPSGFALYGYLRRIGAGVNNPDDRNAIIPTEEQKAELESLGVCFDKETLAAKRKRVEMQQKRETLFNDGGRQQKRGL